MDFPGLGIGATAGGGLSSLLGAAASKPPSAAERAKMAAQQAELRHRSELDGIRSKGLYKFAQEQKLEKLKEKIRQQVLADRGLDEAALSQLPTEQRDKLQSDIETEIARLIQEAMRHALESETQNAKNQGRPPQPLIIDIST